LRIIQSENAESLAKNARQANERQRLGETHCRYYQMPTLLHPRLWFRSFLFDRGTETKELIIEKKTAPK
jgi:hypothetical protein